MLSGSRNAALYGTRKGTLLESVPLGVTTWTVPVAAPFGTVVVISEAEATVKTAAVPSKLTLVAPVRFVPRILTAAPTLPEVGSVSTNGPRPTDSLKTVPSPLAPSSSVVPYKSPLVAWTSPAAVLPSMLPSVHPLWEQKLYSVVSAPLGVILKTVPYLPFAPS